jgi:hypothetical protein
MITSGLSLKQNQNTTMADQENGDSQSGTPQAFLNSVVGQPVWVRLNSGIDYKGMGPAAPALFDCGWTLT